MDGRSKWILPNHVVAGIEIVVAAEVADAAVVIAVIVGKTNRCGVRF